MADAPTNCWTRGLALLLLTFAAACSPQPEVTVPDSGEPAPATAPVVDQSALVTGQGDLRFRVLHKASFLPKVAVRFLNGAHGGFAVDRRPGHGEIYFALPNAGIIRISGDLTSSSLVDTMDSMKRRNLHNTSIWYDAEDNAFLTFPSVDGNRVFTTRTDGSLVSTLSTPKAKDAFTVPAVRDYFRNIGLFIPTDVEVVDNTFYVTTGYSPLDYVLTARVEQTRPFKVDWEPLVFGGKGEHPGQFGTGHGITLTPDGKALTVSDRMYDELDVFDLKGKYLRTIELPEGSHPCDVDYAEGYSIVACLTDPVDGNGAPVYIMKDDEIVSTIRCKDELGLPAFSHIHNAVMVRRNDRLYLLVLAWNPGAFVILEQVDP